MGFNEALQQNDIKGKKLKLYVALNIWNKLLIIP